MSTEFATLAGISEQEALAHSALLRASMEVVRSRLRDDVSEQEHAELLCLLSAAVAYCRYAAMVGAYEGGASVKIGEVTLSSAQGASAKAAQAMCDGLFSLASGILTDSEFVFEGMD